MTFKISSETASILELPKNEEISEDTIEGMGFVKTSAWVSEDGSSVLVLVNGKLETVGFR